MKKEINTEKYLTDFKETINNVIDKRIDESKRSEVYSTFDKLPMGTLKRFFQGMLDTLFENKDGQKLIGAYTRNLTENRDLRKVYLSYKNLQNNYHGAEDLTLLINENLNLLNIDKKNYKKGLEKMAEIVKEAFDLCGKKTEEIEKMLLEGSEYDYAFEYLFTTKKNLKNINEYVENFEKVKKYINENASYEKVEVEEVNEEKKNPSELITELENIFKFGELNEWEKKVVEDIIYNDMSGNGQENLFEAYKKDCSEAIENYLNNSDSVEDKSRFLNMKTQLTEKKYSKDCFTDDLLKLSELKYTLTHE